MNFQTDPEAAAAETMSRAMLPDLLIDSGDLPAAVKAAAALLAKTGQVYDMGGLLVQVTAAPSQPVRIMPFTHHAATMRVHELCHPVTIDKEGKEKPITFPERAAKMLVDTAEGFPKLNGTASTPMLRDDGTIHTATGFDDATGLWCHNVPAIRVPPTPSKADAENALRTIRETFMTFPFSDSQRFTAHDLDVVDIEKPPGEAETALICGLLTAICRASLSLAPGLIITAPDVSGAGSGKGLLVQAICAIAFGSPPAAFTTGSDKAELDKRIASELMQAGVALFLDNANSMALKSDTLASVITERPARVRVFGQTKMVALNSTAFIAITGNGLSVSEDLARRFLACELDPKCDDPEARDFPGRDVFLAGIKARRAELLTAALIIWRWGRQNEASLERGRPFGSFETWAAWVRDPLMNLGCTDPVAQISKAKARDPRRVRIAELFEAWEQHHNTYPMKTGELDDAVKNIADPQGRGRQFLATSIAKLAGTRAAGFVLTRQDAAGTWTGATYQLKKIDQH
ncbi:MAG: hypothetical protein B7Z76_15485 [Acidiphilium sp. 20-67-58]|uniref:hypothetical protein n=1 Tax=Acidiphilium sp. 20-67-58 TaxID=1970291 RepID=UPI000BCE8098|nr:hypothetical protein [Acidiphilium sp. 20-67-58]OYV54162.1 MAG: hypothetical protein B7Z76_15485 [Acidiphilium sp. 20-67-58]